MIGGSTHGYSAICERAPGISSSRSGGYWVLDVNRGNAEVFSALAFSRSGLDEATAALVLETGGDNLVLLGPATLASTLARSSPLLSPRYSRPDLVNQIQALEEQIKSLRVKADAGTKGRPIALERSRSRSTRPSKRAAGAAPRATRPRRSRRVRWTQLFRTGEVAAVGG